MRKVYCCFLASLFWLSCKKETEEVTVINPSDNVDIQLIVDRVVNDSTIVLKWTKHTGSNFQKYRLMRSAMYMKDGRFDRYFEPIDSSIDANHTSFTEMNMPLANNIWYSLETSTDTTQYGQGLRQTANTYYQRPNSLVYGIPTDVLIDRQSHTVYVAERNKISIVNYNTGRITLEKEFPVSVGYCSLGNFSGSLELYVPMNDGWLQILDATTLQLKDRIYVAGFEIGSVVNVDGKLYVSSSDRTFGGYSDCVKVYNRATKNFIGRTGYWDNTRLTVLEGTAVEMIDLSINLSPVSLNYYKFTSGGVPISKKEDSYHGDYSMSADIVRSFPDGSKFITSAYGTIFNKSLVFDRYIKQNGSYADFAFNDAGSLIYAAYASEKKIDVVTYPATTTINTYSTTYYPYKIFRDGNTLISVGKINPIQGMDYLFVEKINL